MLDIARATALPLADGCRYRKLLFLSALHQPHGGRGSGCLTGKRFARRTSGGYLKQFVFVLALVPIGLAAPALAAGPSEVQYGDVPAWVLPPPKTSSDAAQGDAPFRIVYQDTENRTVANGPETFTAYRVQILKPEALSLGNINFTWAPSAGPATVHYVRIIR